MRIAVAGSTGVVGRHIVERVRARGHEAVPLSRGQGVDITTGVGVSAGLSGCDAVIDVANAGTTDEGPATEFFSRSAATLQRYGAERGVRHIITLSIVGIDELPFGYFNAKRRHEQVAGDGAVPTTIQRATQFHEFPAQMMAAARDGNTTTVYDMKVQTIAARTVADALVALAEGTPQHRAPDLAGPEPAELVELARRFVAARELSLEVRADDESVVGMPDGAMLPGPDAVTAGPTFDEWLGSEDAAALPL